MDSIKLIILDTDIGPDCDDAAALAISNLYAAAGKAKLVAVMHCTSSPWGVGAIRAINRWYGSDVPVGTLADRELLTDEAALEKYNKPLSLSLPEDMRDAGDCLPLYRRLLAEADDDSLDLVAIGPLRNVANLLRSGPDEYSPLGGVALVKRKIRRLTLMAGCFEVAPDMPEVEWNVQMDVSSAREVALNWPTEMAYCGFEVGARVMSGGPMQAALPQDHPVREAYRLYTGGGDRQSWDLLTVLHALDAANSGLCESEPGVVEIDARGITRHIPTPGGRHCYLIAVKSPVELSAQLNGLLTGGVTP